VILEFFLFLLKKKKQNARKTITRRDSRVLKSFFLYNIFSTLETYLLIRNLIIFICRVIVVLLFLNKNTEKKCKPLNETKHILMLLLIFGLHLSNSEEQNISSNFVVDFLNSDFIFQIQTELKDLFNVLLTTHNLFFVFKGFIIISRHQFVF